MLREKKTENIEIIFFFIDCWNASFIILRLKERREKERWRRKKTLTYISRVPICGGLVFCAAPCRFAIYIKKSNVYIYWNFVWFANFIRFKVRFFMHSVLRKKNFLLAINSMRIETWFIITFYFLFYSFLICECDRWQMDDAICQDTW